jgi:hypothetical protein
VDTYTPDDLRAAAKRLVEFEARQKANRNAVWLMEHGALANLADDGVTLAEAYLAANPEAAK